MYEQAVKEIKARGRPRGVGIWALPAVSAEYATAFSLMISLFSGGCDSPEGHPSETALKLGRLTHYGLARCNKDG
jgi:hypothetical protein